MMTSRGSGKGLWVLGFVVLLGGLGWGSGLDALPSSAPAASQPADPVVEPACMVDEASELTEPDAARTGFCKCGCGARCQTSADCGGAACIRAITCC
jgi:hypothetical protein